MMHKITREEELERVDTMTTLEAVAFANRLSNRLKCDDCIDGERKNVLELLGRLTERVQFLKISLEPPTFCRIGWNHFAEQCGASKLAETKAVNNRDRWHLKQLQNGYIRIYNTLRKRRPEGRRLSSLVGALHCKIIHIASHTDINPIRDLGAQKISIHNPHHIDIAPSRVVLEMCPGRYHQ